MPMRPILGTASGVRLTVNFIAFGFKFFVEGASSHDAA